MAGKRFSAEKIIQKLHEAEVYLSQGNATRVRKPRDLRALSGKYIADRSNLMENGHGERAQEESAGREVWSGASPVDHRLAGRERETEIEFVPAGRTRVVDSSVPSLAQIVTDCL